MFESNKEPRNGVVYVITKSNWGGAQRYVYDLACAAKERGMKVCVAAGGTGELLTRSTASGLKTVSIQAFTRDVSLAQDMRALRELYVLFKKERPLVVHVNSSKAGIPALAARFAGVPTIIFTVHGWAWNESRPLYQKIAMVGVYWLTFVLSHKVILVSKAARRQARFFPFVQKKVSVIYNGIPLVQLFSREEARAHLVPTSKRAFWIGTIGELHPIKGHSILIEAYEHVVPDVVDSTLLIIGEGQERSALERLMRIEGVSGSTHLLGHVMDAQRYLKAFDIFVLPSRSEGFPYVLLEAGRAGVSVVATNVGGIPEVITDDTTGVLVSYGDRVALTQALTSLALDTTRRERLGKALQEHIQKDFSITQMVEKTFSLY